MFYVSDVHRLNSGPMQQLEHFRTRSAITVEWLYQLYMALEADVWIGTRKSNWNRLIDEMRCVAVLLKSITREWSQCVCLSRQTRLQGCIHGLVLAAVGIRHTLLEPGHVSARVKPGPKLAADPAVAYSSGQ